VPATPPKPPKPSSIPYDFYVYRGELEDASLLEPLSPQRIKDAMKRFPDSLPSPDGYSVGRVSPEGTLIQIRVILENEESGPCTTVVVRTGLETGRSGFETAGEVARYLASALEGKVFDPQAHRRLGASSRTTSWDEALVEFDRQRHTFRSLLPGSSDKQPHNGKPAPRWQFWKRKPAGTERD